MDISNGPHWSPYLVGILIGFLNILALLFSNRAIGASSSYAKISGIIVQKINKDYIEKNEFFKKNPPEIDWGVMLIFGIIIGSFISAIISGDFALIWVPNLWTYLISPAIMPRMLTALAGGIIIGIGSRWAGGCTSGHGISGTAQLSPISIAASISFFIGAISTAAIFYGL